MGTLSKLRDVTWLVSILAIFSMVGVAIAVAAAYGLAQPKGTKVDTGWQGQGESKKDAQPSNVTLNKESYLSTPLVQAPKAKTKADSSPPVAKTIALPSQRASAVQAASAGPQMDRLALTKELQRQLKRTGCYDGAIDGVWTPRTRRSMNAFIHRVNAKLPADQPDYILLAMLQSHQDNACRPTYPNGQGLADDGRCLPNAIVAQAQKKKASSDARPRSVAEAVPHPVQNQTAAFTGLMALAGPQQDGLPTRQPRARAGDAHSSPDRTALKRRGTRYQRSARWRPSSGGSRWRQPSRWAVSNSRLGYQTNRLPVWAARIFAQ